jgi:hypothetical protein
MMRRTLTTSALLCVCFSAACSPRDFLTRRLASDLIAASHTFNEPQQFWLRTGIISNQEYTSPEYLVLQRHGWLAGAITPCPPNVSPPPCWNTTLTPLGVDTFRGLAPADAASSSYFSVPTARRQLLEVTGISKNGNVADVDFVWKWIAGNEIGAALLADGMKYTSTVGFKHYDDGWRLMEGDPGKPTQSLDDALKNARPVS